MQFISFNLSKDFYKESFSKTILHSVFYRLKNYLPEICENVEKVDYQGAEGRSFFQIFEWGWH